MTRASSPLASSALVVALPSAAYHSLLPAPAQADNPIVQHLYTADPAPLVHNGRVYLYTGHDEDASTYFTMKDWRVFSSADMVNWTDHGSPMFAGDLLLGGRERLGGADRRAQREVLLVRPGAASGRTARWSSVSG